MRIIIIILQVILIIESKKNELRKVHEALDLYILKSNIAHSQELLVDIQIMKSKSNSKGGVLNLLQFDFE